MKVVSIDPGTRNLGYAIWESGKGFTAFGSLDLFALCKDKKKRTDYPYLVKLLITQHHRIFHGLDLLLIENQMQAKMKMIACALRCFYFEKAKPISPLAVRKYLKTSCSNYRANKKASVDYVKTILPPKLFARVNKSKKKDDISDALCILHYYLKKYELY